MLYGELKEFRVKTFYQIHAKAQLFQIRFQHNPDRKKPLLKEKLF